ncbi:hypothetical protein SLS64_009984 [Diaporthe eres]
MYPGEWRCNDKFFDHKDHSVHQQHAKYNNTCSNHDSCYFAGTNSYWIGFLTNNADVDLVMSHLQTSGLKILRVWGFNDVNTTPGSGTVWYQSLSGSTPTINTGANGLQRLDYVVKSAEAHGIKLIINFVNNWDDYGGIKAYTNSQYRTYIKAVVSRYITSTAVFAWELANEPRCSGCSTDVIYKWATDTSAYIKSLDSNHMVTLGDEGFNPSTGDGSYPYQTGEGVSFVKNLGIPTLDFGTYHIIKSAMPKTLHHAKITPHSFSFADWYDPRFSHFGSLRVLNEDRVKAQNGFPTHPHRDFEIFSYILSGELTHRDSMLQKGAEGGQSDKFYRMHRGDVQFTTGGTGIAHSEQNEHRSETVHFLQIWAIPWKRGLIPCYHTKHFPDEEKRKGFVNILSPLKAGEDASKAEEDEAKPAIEGTIPIHADFVMSAGIIAPEQKFEWKVGANVTQATKPK